MAQEVMIRVPDSGVHVIIFRGSGERAIDQKELVYSHILLAIRVLFGPRVQFNWVNPEDWINFCNGEKIAVQIVGQTTLVMVSRGYGRVVYVHRVVEAIR